MLWSYIWCQSAVSFYLFHAVSSLFEAVSGPNRALQRLTQRCASAVTWSVCLNASTAVKKVLKKYNSVHFARFLALFSCFFLKSKEGFLICLWTNLGYVLCGETICCFRVIGGSVSSFFKTCEAVWHYCESLNLKQHVINTVEEPVWSTKVPAWDELHIQSRCYCKCTGRVPFY